MELSAEKEIENYLAEVDKYLKRIPVSERADIILELKSNINEMRVNETFDSGIAAKLGTARELAAGYLGDKITEESVFGVRKFLMVFSFLAISSIGGMFIIPCGTVFAGGCMLSGIISVIAGFIKFAGYIFGFEVPFVMFQFGSFSFPPLQTFLLAEIFGVLLFLSGMFLWKAVVGYIRIIGKMRKGLNGKT